jgi:hypothetical protein
MEVRGTAITFGSPKLFQFIQNAAHLIIFVQTPKSQSELFSMIKKCLVIRQTVVCETGI